MDVPINLIHIEQDNVGGSTGYGLIETEKSL